MDHPHHEMPMIEPTAADSFTLKASPLPRAGWTATASDQAPAYPAGNVIDAVTTTIWHSAYAPQPAPLPAEAVADFVGADRRMACRNDFQHTSTLRRQAHLALGTKMLRSGKHARHAMLMVMARSRKEDHWRTWVSSYQEVAP